MIWKILGIAFVGVVSFVIIKKANSDVAVAISVVTGAIIIALILQSIIEIFESFFYRWVNLRSRSVTH